jgi:hypothetical protein
LSSDSKPHVPILMMDFNSTKVNIPTFVCSHNCKNKSNLAILKECKILVVTTHQLGVDRLGHHGSKNATRMSHFRGKEQRGL